MSAPHGRESHGRESHGRESRGRESREREPRDVLTALERAPRLTGGVGDHFVGYAVTAVTFDSGHVLALRRHPATSIGPAYGCVWLRDPAGRWTLHADVDRQASCARYYGGPFVDARTGAIRLTWAGPRSLSVAVDDLELAWVVHLAPSRRTRLAGALHRRVPGALRRSDLAARLLERATAAALGVDRLGLRGASPSGHRYRIWPRELFAIDASAARLRGRSLGRVRHDAAAPRIGGMPLPRRGVLLVGETTYLPGVAALHPEHAAESPLPLSWLESSPGD